MDDNALEGVAYTYSYTNVDNIILSTPTNWTSNSNLVEPTTLFPFLTLPPPPPLWVVTMIEGPE